MELKIKNKKIAELKFDPKNARTHSDDQIDQIANSIRQFGFLNPLLVDPDGMLIAGEGRLRAAERLELKTVPVIIVEHLSSEQRRALAIADNKIALNSGWNSEVLKAEINALNQAGADTAVLGFSATELAQLYGLEPAPGNREDDHVPEDKPIVSNLGDVWCLGRHRLMCGNSTAAADVRTLMNGQKASMVFTDPPYGVDYESDVTGKIQGDSARGDELVNSLLLPAMKEMVKYTVIDAAFYIWHASRTRSDFEFAMKSAGLVERQYLIWVKPQLVLGHMDYHQSDEPCFYASRAEKSPAFYGARNQTTCWYATLKTAEMQAATLGKGIVVIDGSGAKIYIQPKEPKSQKAARTIRIQPDQPLLIAGPEHLSGGTAWEVGKDTTKYIHPTQKPVELATRAIQNSSKVGEIVLDLFSGSGTTLIGAEKLKRTCYAMDLDPKFVDRAVRRWQDFTGAEATLESNGKTFNKISK